MFIILTCLWVLWIFTTVVVGGSEVKGYLQRHRVGTFETKEECLANGWYMVTGVKSSDKRVECRLDRPPRRGQDARRADP